MSAWDIFQLIFTVIGLVLCGYVAGEEVGWSKAERWFWATREKK